VVEVEIHRLEGVGSALPCRGRVELRVPRSSTDAPEPPALLGYGLRLRGWAEWNVPRNFGNPGSADRAAHLARHGIFLLGRVKSPRLLAAGPGDCASAWKRVAFAARARIRRDLRRLATRGRPQEAAVLESLVLGDSSELDARVREEFQNSGTYHVLVV